MSLVNGIKFVRVLIDSNVTYDSMTPDYPFYVPDYDRAGKHANQNPLSSKIFQYPISYWYGERSGKRIKKLRQRVTRLMERCYPALPVIVIYNLPDRDVGQHSKGGSHDMNLYFEFIEDLALGIGEAQPIIIFEPDALPHSTLMEPSQAQYRYEAMHGGLVLLDELCQGSIYVDVGHSNWLTPIQAATLLNRVAIPQIRGFSVNVSNFRTTTESMSWAKSVSEYTAHKHFVIDTSRNGSGPCLDEWCNPPDRSLGVPATTATGSSLCDAFLWIKVPGESDGTANGGPRAGKFWPEYASALVKNTNTSWLS